MEISIYEQYFEAEAVFEGVLRKAALVSLQSNSQAGFITYKATVTFFPHRDEEDYAVSYDAFDRLSPFERQDLLMKAVLTLGSTEDAYRFFEDLCTIPEIKSISQRLEVAYLLDRKETYQKIADETGASSATISRVNRSLTYGADGYRRVLDAMGEEK